MNTYLAWVLLAVALWLTAKAGLALLKLWWGRRGAPGSQEEYERVERASMPAELVNAKLVINERTLWRRGQRPFAAKTDQVFLTQDGMLVPVETKARRRVYDSDVVQLSCQAIALAHTAGVKGRPADWGYVRLAAAGARPRYQRVALLPSEKIDLLWDRWDDLRQGRVPAIARPAHYRCTHCQLRTRCPDAVLNRPRNGRG